MNNKKINSKRKIQKIQNKIKEFIVVCMSKKSDGIDGILVTVGLCIIALVLCVVMKDKLAELITTIVSSMTTKAESILQLNK